MEFRVDPFTGGIKKVDLDHEDETRKHLKKKLAKNNIPEFIKEMALNPNPKFNPRPSRLKKLNIASFLKKII